ncbi:MAG: glycine--tRNA ligase, partial [Candidatus Asgardarchaeia archaeon]
VPAEKRLKGEEEATEVTVKEMLDSGFVKNEWLVFFMALAKRFLIELGIPETHQRFIEKLEWERAHYSSQGFDQEVLLGRLGWIEVSGHNYRTDYDLKRHMEHSGVDLTVYKELEKPRVIEENVLKPNKAKIGPEFKEASNEVIRLIEEADLEEVERSFREKGFYMAGKYKILPEHVSIGKVRKEIKGEKFIPHVIEPSFGSDRLVYATLVHSYYRKEERNILKLPIDVAPIQVAVYPLVDKEPLSKIALEIFRELRDEGFRVDYDASASIGRRYARADEIGVPLAITVDSLTVKEGTVTVRDRDSWRQVRIRRENLPKILYEYFKGKITFEEMEGTSK